MAQQIDVPGVGVVEFPDGMSDDEIASAIKKNLPAQEQKQETKQSFVDRALNLAKKANAVGMITELLNSPSAMRGIGLTGRAIGESAAGLADLAAMTNPAVAMRRLSGAEPSLQENMGRTLDILGAYKPETKGERLLSDIAGGAYGSMAGGPMSALPRTLLSGAGAGLATGMAREGGGGLAAQVGAGLIGGALPAVTRGTLGYLGDKIGDIGATVGAGFGNKASLNRLAEDAAQRISGKDADFIRAAELSAKRYAGTPTTTAEAIAQRNALQSGVRGGSTVRLQQDLSGAKGAADILPSVEKIQDKSIIERAAQLAGGSTADEQKAALDAAFQARQAGAGAQYQALAGTRVNMTPELATLLNSQAGADAYMLAKKIAMNDSAARVASGQSPIPFVFRNKDGKVVGFSAQGLQYIKSAMDDMATNPNIQSTTGISGTATNKVGNVRDALVDYMNKSIPGWEKARLDYAAQSQPVNRLQVGQGLFEALKTERDTLTPEAFMRGTGRGAERLAKTRTGQAREVDWGPQQQVIDDIREQLVRRSVAENIGKKVKDVGGSNIGSQDVPQIPNTLNLASTITNYGLKMLGRSANDPLNAFIANKMANGTYHELLRRPLGDPFRTAMEAAIATAAGTATSVDRSEDNALKSIMGAR